MDGRRAPEEDFEAEFNANSSSFNFEDNKEKPFSVFFTSYLSGKDGDDLLNDIQKQLQMEHKEFMELLRTVDPTFSEKDGKTCSSIFSGFEAHVKEILYQQLENILSPEDVTHQIKKARRDLCTMSYEYIANVFWKDDPIRSRYTPALKKLVEMRNRLTLNAPLVLHSLSNSKSSSSRSKKTRAKKSKRKRPDLSSFPSSSSSSSSPSSYSGYKRRKKHDDRTLIEYRSSRISKCIRFFTLSNIFRLAFDRLPIISWLPFYFALPYRFQKLQGDLLSAISCAFMLIPKSLSFALIAELPPIYGMYTAFVPMMSYSVFGTSSEVSIGPVAVLSLLTPGALEPIVGKPGTEIYNQGALSLAFIIGILLILAFLLRIGFLIKNVLSHPILAGFVSASATIICLSQLKHILRIDLHGNTVPEIFSDLYHHAGEIHKYSVILGLICIFVIFYIRVLISKKVPMALVLIVVITFLSWVFQFHETFGLKIVDQLPNGLPTPGFPLSGLSISQVYQMIPSAALMAVIAFIEQISIAKKFAAEKRYEINVSQELFAIGICNVIGSCFQAYSVTGSMSTSAINYQQGSETPLNNLLCSIFIGIVLLFFTSLFAYTPLCVLAGIIIAAAVGLIEVSLPSFLYQMRDFVDLGNMLIVYFGTLLFGPEIGIVIAIVISLLQVIYRLAKPRFDRLGRLPGTLVYKDLRKYKDAISQSRILLLRFESSLIFANVVYFKEKMLKYQKREQTKPEYIIVDCSGMHSVDSTGVMMMKGVREMKRKEGIGMLWANVKDEVMDKWISSGLLDSLGGEEVVFASTHDAVEWAVEEVRKLEEEREEKKRENGMQGGDMEEARLVFKEEGGSFDDLEGIGVRREEGYNGHKEEKEKEKDKEKERKGKMKEEEEEEQGGSSSQGNGGPFVLEQEEFV